MSGKMLKINAELAFFTETFSELKNCQFKTSNMFSSLQHTTVQTDEQTTFRSSFKNSHLMNPLESKSINLTSHQFASQTNNEVNQMNQVNQINQVNQANQMSQQPAPVGQVNNSMIINLNRDIYFKNNQLNNQKSQPDKSFNNENNFNRLNMKSYNDKVHPIDSSTCESSESSTTSSNSSIVNSNNFNNLQERSVGICNGIPTA